MTSHSPIYTTLTVPDDWSGTQIQNISTLLVPARQGRRWICIQNISAADIWINFGAAATVGAGSYHLLPNGIGIFQQECNSYLACDVYAISASGTQQITAKDI